MLAASLALASSKPGDALLGSPDLRLSPASQSASSLCASTRSPQRVVSASLLTDELLLGVLPFERWSAVSYVVDYPASTPVHDEFPKSLPRTSGSAEQILSYRPDLVLVSDYSSAATAAQLEEAGVCVRRVTRSQTFEQLFERWLELGRWVGAPERAEARVKDEKRKLERLRSERRSETLRVLLLQGMFSYGSGTLQDECLRLLGLENVLGDPRFGATPALNVEQLLSLNPDTIFVAADVAAPGAASSEHLPEGVPWSLLKATEHHQVFAIPASWMASISHHALKACEAYGALTRDPAR